MIGKAVRPRGVADGTLGSRMPRRATKRGAERTPLGGDYDVLICGASFAGLAVARELAGTGARVLVVDRYEIGERQTSACAAPTEWLEAMGVADSIRQTFDDAGRQHAPSHGAVSPPVDVLDLRLPRALRACSGTSATRSSRPPRSRAAAATTVHTDRGDLAAPLARRRARLEAGARRQRLPAARRAALARARGPPPRLGRGARDLDRPLLRPRRLLVELSGRERGAGRGRLVRPAVSRQGADRPPRRATSIATPSATRATGSRTSFARRPPTASSSSATRPATACR